MARVTVEDCLDHVENRFELALLAAKRARQLTLGQDEPLVPWHNDKPGVVALREFAAGKLNKDKINAVEERARNQQLHSNMMLETETETETEAEAETETEVGIEEETTTNMDTGLDTSTETI